MPTPLRNIRVADDLWAAALKKADKEGREGGISEVIREALEQYVATGVKPRRVIR